MKDKSTLFSSRSQKKRELYYQTCQENYKRANTNYDYNVLVFDI